MARFYNKHFYKLAERNFGKGGIQDLGDFSKIKFIQNVRRIRSHAELAP